MKPKLVKETVETERHHLENAPDFRAHGQRASWCVSAVCERAETVGFAVGFAVCGRVCVFLHSKKSVYSLTHSPLSDRTRYCDDISDALSRITSPFSPKHTTTASKDANAILHASHGHEHALQPSLLNLSTTTTRPRTRRMLYIVHPPGIFPASVRACLTRRRSAQREWVLRVVMEPADAYTTFEVFWRHCGSFVGALFLLLLLFAIGKLVGGEACVWVLWVLVGAYDQFVGI